MLLLAIAIAVSGKRFYKTHVVHRRWYGRSRWRRLVGGGGLARRRGGGARDGVAPPAGRSVHAPPPAGPPGRAPEVSPAGTGRLPSSSHDPFAVSTKFT